MAAPRTPVISLKGKPFERGQQYGTQAHELVRKNVELYFDLWGRLWGAERPAVLAQCAGLATLIGEYDAGILEEMQGLARGADLSLEEVIALNARYEMVFAQSALPQSCGGCTSAAALPPATRNGHAFIGQNWDYKTRFQEMSVLLEAEQQDGPAYLAHVEAGTLGHKGMNSAGLGVCLNALVSSRDRFQETVPFLVVGRAVLNADSLSEAIKAVVRARVGVSFNFLIAHRDGEAIDLEASPADVGFLHPQEDILTHSNHFIALSNRADMVDIFKTEAPDTLYRAHRARRLLEQDRGQIDVASFQRTFRDHFSQPNSICRHIDTRDPEPKHLATLSSVIMDLTAGAFYFTEGTPCRNEYHKVTSRLLA